MINAPDSKITVDAGCVIRCAEDTQILDTMGKILTSLPSQWEFSPYVSTSLLPSFKARVLLSFAINYFTTEYLTFSYIVDNGSKL